MVQSCLQQSGLFEYVCTVVTISSTVIRSQISRFYSFSHTHLELYFKHFLSSKLWQTKIKSSLCWNVIFLCMLLTLCFSVSLCCFYSTRLWHAKSNISDIWGWKQRKCENKNCSCLPAGTCSQPCSREPCWPQWCGSWSLYWMERSSYVPSVLA